MGGTIVDRDGIVCAVAFTGINRGDQWPGSRVISAQKANTDNAFSLPHLALSTANLYTAVQPGGSLFGLQESNPVDHRWPIVGIQQTTADRTIRWSAAGLAASMCLAAGWLCTVPAADLLGGLGVSGDSSCADHNIAWRTRDILDLDSVPAGVSGDPVRKDNIVYDIVSQGGQMPGVSAGGWGHPHCVNPAARDTTIAAGLPPNE